MRRKLMKVAPWLITAGILIYLFTKVPFKEVLEATSKAAPWTIPAVVVCVFGIYLTDCLAIWKTFGWFVARLSFRETLVLRAATYLLAMVNYTLGQGAFVYFLNRTRGVKVMRAAAAVLLIMGINVLLLLLLATLGLLLGAEPLPGLQRGVYIAYAGLVVYIVLLIWRPAFLTRRPALEVLLTAGLGGHLKALLVRVPHTCALLVFNYVAFRAFGVKVPVLQLVLCLPVVFLAGVLPAIAGLGPVQAAMVFFFARPEYVIGTEDERQAAVLAASLGSSFIAWCVQSLLGIAGIRSHLGQTLKDVPKETTPES